MFRFRSLVCLSVLLLLSGFANAQSVYYSTSVSHSTEVATAASTLATALGGTAQGFNGSNDAEWITAVANASVIVQGESSQVASLDAATRTAIANFVSNGGSLMLMRSSQNLSLMNEILGVSMTMGSWAFGSGSPEIPRTAAGDASVFSAAPATLPTLDDHLNIDSTSISGPVISAYELSDQTYVAFAPFGSGSVTYFSWDWCCGDTPDLREAWDSSLLAAANFTPLAQQTIAPIPVANPVALGLLTLMLGLFGYRSLRRRTS